MKAWSSAEAKRDGSLPAPAVLVYQELLRGSWSEGPATRPVRRRSTDDHAPSAEALGGADMAADRHIRNPFEMAVTGLGDAVPETGRAIAQARPRGAVSLETPEVRRIATADIMDALRCGAADVGAARGDVFFIALIYPLAGILIAAAMFETRLTPLIFPLVAGFALLGPLAAVGLYEISRRRERGEPVSASTPLAVLRSPAMGDVLRLGALLVAIFFAWLVAAWAIYAVTLGPEPPATVRAFATE